MKNPMLNLCAISLVWLALSYPNQSARADNPDANASGFSLSGLVDQPATGDVYGKGATGEYGRITDSVRTGESPADLPIHRQDNETMDRQLPSLLNLPITQTTTLDKTQLHKMPGALPQTRLDSFVSQAGGSAEMIYGDEGLYDIPPLFGFTEGSRINTGIHSNLTTGHQSGLPEAWGYPN